uniref:Uncharacterized protein n=1 Tax=Trichogramma kaykai TaxID=54128 RepID=A0ABD2VTZ0_9HYME
MCAATSKIDNATQRNEACARIDSSESKGCCCCLGQRPNRSTLQSRGMLLNRKDRGARRKMNGNLLQAHIGGSRTMTCAHKSEQRIYRVITRGRRFSWSVSDFYPVKNYSTKIFTVSILFLKLFAVSGTIKIERRTTTTTSLIRRHWKRIFANNRARATATAATTQQQQQQHPAASSAAAAAAHTSFKMRLIFVTHQLIVMYLKTFKCRRVQGVVRANRQREIYRCRRRRTAKSKPRARAALVSRTIARGTQKSTDEARRSSRVGTGEKKRARKLELHTAVVYTDVNKTA